MECYPSLHYEPCSGCPPHAFGYHDADALRPEMTPVYAWLDQRLGSHQIQLPGGYCIFFP